MTAVQYGVENLIILCCVQGYYPLGAKGTGPLFNPDEALVSILKRLPAL